jgi:hypothetical protein
MSFAALAVVAALALGAFAPAASAAPLVTAPEHLDRPPDGFVVTPREARQTADGVGSVMRARAEHRDLRGTLVIPLYRPGPRYEVTYRLGGKALVDVHVHGRSGRVLEVWTGPQADTILARGYDPSFGRSLNAWYVWLPLALLFLLPFFDFRRPLRLLHLDLLALLAFGVSQFFFNRGEIDLSVPLALPPLLYLLARLLAAGFRPGRPRGPLVPHVPVSALLVGLLVLIGFRITLNAVDSHVIDVGFASVFGADRISHGEELYTRGNPEGTYGPALYMAYVPFEALFPADGPGGYTQAARAAAVTFDLLLIACLLAFGARLRRGREGRVLGIALAYAWCAYPFSLYALQTNTNDALVAVLVLLALLAWFSGALRGALLGLAAAVKFAPLALAPLLLRGSRPTMRDSAMFVAALVVVIAVWVAGHLPDGGPREFWDATIGWQLGRSSPFSPWGLYSGLDWLQAGAKIAAAGLALSLIALPRRRNLRQLAALAGAVIIAVQLTAEYWFYLYIVWFAPLVLIVAMGDYRVEPWRAGIALHGRHTSRAE